MDVVVLNGDEDTIVNRFLKGLSTFPFQDHQFQWMITGGAGVAVQLFNKSRPQVSSEPKEYGFAIYHDLWVRGEGSDHFFYDRGVILDDVENQQVPILARGHWPEGAVRHVFLDVPVPGIQGAAYVGPSSRPRDRNVEFVLFSTLVPEAKKAVRNLPLPFGLSKGRYCQQLESGVRLVPRIPCRLLPWLIDPDPDEKLIKRASDFGTGHPTEARLNNLAAVNPENGVPYVGSNDVIRSLLRARLQPESPARLNRQREREILQQAVSSIAPALQLEQEDGEQSNEEAVAQHPSSPSDEAIQSLLPGNSLSLGLVHIMVHNPSRPTNRPCPTTSAPTTSAPTTPARSAIRSQPTSSQLTTSSRPTNSELPWPILLPRMEAWVADQALQELNLTGPDGNQVVGFAAPYEALQHTETQESYTHRVRVICYGTPVDAANALPPLRASGSFDIDDIRPLWVQTPIGTQYWGGYRRICPPENYHDRCTVEEFNQLCILNLRTAKGMVRTSAYDDVVSGRMYIPKYYLQFSNFRLEIPVKVYQKVYKAGFLLGLRILKPNAAEWDPPEEWLAELKELIKQYTRDEQEDALVASLRRRLALASLAAADEEPQAVSTVSTTSPSPYKKRRITFK
ncbi:hypothetical protein FRB90_001461 [Tulasnella sp. 427]|nr:hypothetical protein FRB90_001461 [Tulasnella sp. 427]